MLLQATIVSIVIEEGFEHDPTLGLRMKEEDEEDEDEERELHWSDLVEVRLVQKSSSSSNDKESLAQLKQNWLAMLDT